MSKIKVEISCKQLMEWFKAALRTEKRLPSPLPKKRITTYWEIKQDDWYGYGWNKPTLKVQTSSRSISQMMFCYELLGTVKEEDDRKLLLCRAGNIPWKEISYRLGKHRSTLDKRLSIVLLDLIEQIRINKSYRQTLQKLLTTTVS
tara:strand:+ start:3887 stop:4324 length:438 start_codon:yes stop_codon:yes gene_type:complete